MHFVFDLISRGLGTVGSSEPCPAWGIPATRGGHPMGLGQGCVGHMGWGTVPGLLPASQGAWEIPETGLQGWSSHHAWLTTLLWAADREFLNFYYCSGLLLPWKEPILILETSASWTKYILSGITIRFFFLLSKTEDWDFQEPVYCTGPSLLSAVPPCVTPELGKGLTIPAPTQVCCCSALPAQFMGVWGQSYLNCKVSARSCCPVPISCPWWSVCAHSVKARCW